MDDDALNIRNWGYYEPAFKGHLGLQLMSSMADNAQMTAVAIDRMMGYQLLSNLAIVAWVFSLGNVAQFNTSDRPWEIRKRAGDEVGALLNGEPYDKLKIFRSINQDAANHLQPASLQGLYSGSRGTKTEAIIALGSKNVASSVSEPLKTEEILGDPKISGNGGIYYLV